MTSPQRRVLRGSPMTASLPLCSVKPVLGEAMAAGACWQPRKLPASMPAVADGGRSIVAALDAAVAVDAYAERPFVAAELEELPVVDDEEMHVGLLLLPVARSGGLIIGPAADQYCSSGTSPWGESKAQS